MHRKHNPQTVKQKIAMLKAFSHYLILQDELETTHLIKLIQALEKSKVFLKQYLLILLGTFFYLLIPTIKQLLLIHKMCFK